MIVEHAGRQTIPCTGCARAVATQSIEWLGACGVPVTRYWCAGDPCTCTEMTRRCDNGTKN